MNSIKYWPMAAVILLSACSKTTDVLGEPYTAKRVTAGYEFTCALLHDDQIKCWGDNSHSQHGYGDLNDRGDEPSEMGDNLPVVDLGTGITVSEIFAYYNRNCAILTDGNARCRGTNSRNGRQFAILEPV
ncbi:RCC1 domain-containing protein [Salinibius halmophilus]|uniref:RCC1 domain-containing protein n=1 Tax=Salinibius halmophilus TaxID=1853216 RepID=UPI000E663662|nr:RCC1 domain-containing protein [Salinibius halmophilus]